MCEQKGNAVPEEVHSCLKPVRIPGLLGALMSPRSLYNISQGAYWLVEDSEIIGCLESRDSFDNVVLRSAQSQTRDAANMFYLYCYYTYC